MTRDTVYGHLREHQKKGLSPFHTPGHKNSGCFPPELLQLDLTELPDTDALYEAEGILLRAEEKLASLFGAKRSLISSGGCTLAIQTMLCIASQRGRKMLFGRNIHRSAINACALLGIEPLWLMPKSESGHFTGRVTPGDVESALREHGDISACYLTSPDYYGELSDIRTISSICRRYGVLLLVDNAHGSHLAFLSENLHPLHLGADMTACSLHKTLPVLTGGAVLNIGSHELAKDAKDAMVLFGSTSPSYPIMASIDWCRDWLENSGAEKYKALEERVMKIKQLASKQGLLQPKGQCDPLRVCINTACAGIEGSRQTAFFHRFGIEPEFCDGQNAVMICTPFNTERDFMRLEQAISSLSYTCDPPETEEASLPEMCMSPRDALLSNQETVPLSKASGRISAGSACPCPPGIPLVMPGEVITEELAGKLHKSGFDSIRCVLRR